MYSVDEGELKMMCHPGGDFHVFLSDLPTAICQCGRQRIDGRPVYLCKPP